MGYWAYTGIFVLLVSEKIKEKEEKMKLEQQVCNLELSKQLKELGVEQESLWYHRIYGTNKDKHEICNGKPTNPSHEIYSAFTVAELGELLPENISLCKYEVGRKIGGKGGGILRWACAYNDENIGKRICDDTEADARAKMLLWLLKKEKKK